MILELLKANLSEAIAKAASAITLALTRVSEDDGVQSVVGPGQWSQASLVGFAAQSSTTKAAVAGVRHICTGISAVFATGATAQAGALDVVLRDGLTGAGPILWAKRFILPANAIYDINLTNLNIVGSLGAAMTLEFVAAGAAGSVESVTLSGYDAL